ncbi:leukemia NUP98 fusion partner 1 isoform X2 [Protopterus annectens]|uniref:leukemia NUP98 fusion partner 1 isoform X2 n=1 Tax=Protopterus annectens TaxID=7888 RepID=UPI001CFA82C9|nr:leukemia NUP98 fusion partner 1 isoform X2 [Protopterus annectens]
MHTVLAGTGVSSLYTEYEENDDVIFAKWMSSFWGHSWMDETEKEIRARKKRHSRALSERRASLPCPSQLSAMQLTEFHSSSKGQSTMYPKFLKQSREDIEVKCHAHLKICKTSSMDTSLPRTSVPKRRSNSIQGLPESFEKHLRIRSRQVTSTAGHPDGSGRRRSSAGWHDWLRRIAPGIHSREEGEGEDEVQCVICHVDQKTGGPLEFSCNHKLHKEAGHLEVPSRRRSSSAWQDWLRKIAPWTHNREDEPLHAEIPPRRRLSSGWQDWLRKIAPGTHCWEGENKDGDSETHKNDVQE